MPDPAHSFGVWVYAVCSDADENNIEAAVGVDGETPRLVREADLTAVVGSVDLTSFGEEGLRRSLNDLDQLESIARAHHDVIRAVAGPRPVLPSRLATVYEDDSGVRTALREHRGAFAAALERVGGRQEWGVKAYRQRVDHAATSEPGPPKDPAGSGTAYLRRRQEALSAQESSRKSIMAGAETLYAQLSALAVSVRRHRPQDPQLSGDDRWMALNAAYLVDDDQAETFAEEVAALARTLPELAVEVTGPWPPYSFADVDEEDRP
jgi:Gas vesicle synthesis protein GvpL/GvpF